LVSLRLLGRSFVSVVIFPGVLFPFSRTFLTAKGHLCAYHISLQLFIPTRYSSLCRFGRSRWEPGYIISCILRSGRDAAQGKMLEMLIAGTFFVAAFSDGMRHLIRFIWNQDVMTLTDVSFRCALPFRAMPLRPRVPSRFIRGLLTSSYLNSAPTSITTSLQYILLILLALYSDLDLVYPSLFSMVLSYLLSPTSSPPSSHNTDYDHHHHHCHVGALLRTPPRQ